MAVIDLPGATGSSSVGEGGGSSSGGNGGEQFVGLLDIFGFENFAHNSLEQLCINFANEKLQSQFISALVATQRAEYVAEGIACGAIAFPENSEQLSLLDGRLGIMALLDEECTLLKGSEEAYVEKMHKRFSALTSYGKPQHGTKRGAPGVPASARATSAQTQAGGSGAPTEPSSWCAITRGGHLLHRLARQNRDHLAPNVLAMLAGSHQPLLSTLFTEMTLLTRRSTSPTLHHHRGVRRQSLR